MAGVSFSSAHFFFTLFSFILLFIKFIFFCFSSFHPSVLLLPPSFLPRFHLLTHFIWHQPLKHFLSPGLAGRDNTFPAAPGSFAPAEGRGRRTNRQNLQTLQLNGQMDAPGWSLPRGVTLGRLLNLLEPRGLGL